MKIKVAYHDGYGPFGLPLVVAERFCELSGIKIDMYEYSKRCQLYYLPNNTPRHDPNLIKTIEEFLDECAKAQILLHELKGRKYIINEYDGLEWVQEPHDIVWIEARK